MSTNHHEKMVGVIGGMGPLASAEFLKTIYQYNFRENEQEAPIVLLHSDPTFPDRNEALLGGNSTALLTRLIDVLEYLCEQGATDIVICCVTIHYLVPMLPNKLKEKIISLVDTIVADVAQTSEQSLMLCSTGSRKLGIFQNHPQKKVINDYLIMPDDNDQNTIHNLIYQIKRGQNLEKVAPAIETMMERYGVNSFVAGCTEIHLLSKYFLFYGKNPKYYSCIDPLISIAKSLADL